MARSQEKKIHFSKLNIDTMQAPIQQISTRVSIISQSCYNNSDDCSNNYYFIIIIMTQAMPLHASAARLWLLSTLSCPASCMWPPAVSDAVHCSLQSYLIMSIHLFFCLPL